MTVALCSHLLVQMRMELVVSCHYRQPHEYRHFGLAALKEKKRFQ